MKTYKKFRKPSKLILAWITHSKSVQIAWILMILINLTHFFVDFLEVFFLLSRKPFHYRSLFKKWKKKKRKKRGKKPWKKRSHPSVLAVSLIFAEMFFNLLDFCWKFRNFVTFIKPERHFSTFSKNNTQPPSIVFLIKSYNFHEKSWVFLKNRKKWMV